MSRPALELRTGQHLALTPQLQQSIRLLQLSTLDLELEVSQALVDNPLLERDDDDLEDAFETQDESPGAADESSSAVDDRALSTAELASPNDEPGTLASEHESAGDEPSIDGLDDVFGADAVLDAMAEPLGSGAGGDFEDDLGQAESALDITLREHLLDQLRMTRATDRDRLLVGYLIDELDDNGYLGSSLPDILSWFFPLSIETDNFGALGIGTDAISTSVEAVNIEANATAAADHLATVAPDLDELRAALRLLQSFDPPGVGAADLSDCLILQLRFAAHHSPSEAVRTLALEICRAHLPLLATGNVLRLREALGCDEPTLRSARALILTLNPRPGRAWTVPAAAYAVPDVVVKRVRHAWRVSLNAAAVPKLRVNGLYAQMLGNQRASQHPGLQSQLQQAKWMIRNVEQRFETILKVSQAIVDRQSAFLSEGPAAMRPLILKDIADEIGMHESTISRATSQKFMLTPFGTMELKRFFGSGVATDSGDTASATAVQAFIRKLIDTENRAKPLSDNQITKKLAEGGIVIARRTVAKYRETLRIQPASLRRSHETSR